MSIQLPAIEAANLMIDKHFPRCNAAILSGSVIRGEETQTSDLDIIIFDFELSQSYRESFCFAGWPVEAFLHNDTSYRHFFDQDATSGTPTMQRMISEGNVIRNHPLLASIQTEAQNQLEQGPDLWSDEVIRLKRYFLTDAIEDLIGSEKRGEDLFIAAALAERVHEFYLRTNGQWIGKSKWIVRALKSYDEHFADRFVSAFDEFYIEGEKQRVIAIADEVLQPFGGRLFNGFSMGK